MLYIDIPEIELYSEEKNEFVKHKPHRIQLEHSLVSISEWESKWKKPFLNDKEPKTSEQTRDYIRCMTITQNVGETDYDYILGSPYEMERINAYINDSMTATWFNDKVEGKGRPGSREIITSEVVYYYMIQANIPYECRKWHINRLLTLLRVCKAKSEPAKKMSKRELAQRNTALNAQRLAAAKARAKIQ